MRGDSRAHPRSRGENAPPRQSTVCGHGSSPLTRGKPQPAFLKDLTERLIPAHAGKTGEGTENERNAQAHPRSRGENHQRACQQRPSTGSSPLTRGKPWAVTPLTNAKRLIPAHAGKTTYEGSVTFPRAAHPRSRGENDPGGRRQVGAGGSSPLTRGKPASGEDRRRRAGLIPAHAGKTTRPTPPPSRLEAHPRSRGENYGQPRRRA